MKEQDIIHNIEEKTKHLPIPDSISPDAMKNMLDENMEWNEHTSPYTNHTESSKKSENDNILKTSLHNPRFIRRFTAAACIILCLAGSFSIFRLWSEQNPALVNLLKLVVTSTAKKTKVRKKNWPVRLTYSLLPAMMIIMIH